MHATTTTTAPARPCRRKPLSARNAAIAALGIVSAPIAAAGAAVGGGKPVPLHTPAAPAASRAVTISPSALVREGVIEIRFAEKPAPEVLAGLIRWARRSRCRHGRDRAYAENLAK
jgi:hypothetical protein